MATVLFVHGTGVREESYGDSFEKVSAELAKAHNVIAAPCYWGHLASELRNGGASIPQYDSTRAIGEAEGAIGTDEEYSVALWGILADDPLYELRILALRTGTAAVERPPGTLPPGAELARAAQRCVVTPELRSLLETGGIDRTFEDACLAITSSASFRTAMDGAPPALADYRAAIARACIAEAEARAAQEGAPAAVSTDADLRDSIEREIIRSLGGEERSIGGWVKEQLGGFVSRLGTRYVANRRGAVSDAAYPGAGDILLYQARGHEIRNFIKDRITKTAPPRVLLAHSLGGIACVDLLVSQALGVELLITAGSQAPFLYEINALHSLPHGQELPDGFPRWVNIYDLRDFLSYVGERIFQGRVKDVRVDNREPFPASHSAYWSNPSVWNVIRGVLP
jgi:hypothetical protein